MGNTQHVQGRFLLSPRCCHSTGNCNFSISICGHVRGVRLRHGLRLGQRQYCLSRAGQDTLRQSLDLGEDVYIEEVYRALAERLIARTAGFPPPAKYIVAIAGIPGSGKSTTARAVSQCINSIRQRQDSSQQDWAIHIPMDGFHLTRKQLDDMPNPEEAHMRRGADWTFDAHEFVEAIREIRHAGSGHYPSFDHAVGDPVERDIEVCKEHRIVLIEGNYVLLDTAPWRDIRNLVDETWFVDCAVEIAMQRVLKRQTGNGLSLEEARNRVATNDLPNALQIAETKSSADLVLELPGLPHRGRGLHP